MSGQKIVYLNKETDLYEISLKENQETDDNGTEEDESSSAEERMSSFLSGDSNYEFREIENDISKLKKGNDVTVEIEREESKEDKLFANRIDIKTYSNVELE